MRASIATENEMATMTYKEQLLHPNWQRKRLEVMEDAEFKCESCGTAEVTLNVHHRRYAKGRMVWEYERRELACLCKDCHLQEHQQRELLDRLLMVNPRALCIVIGILGGYLHGELDLDDEDRHAVMDAAEPWFDMGILASILDVQLPDAYFRAAIAAGVSHLNPAQELAIVQWREFSIKLEKSGL